MTEQIRNEGIRIDSLDPSVRACMPSVIRTIEANCSNKDSCFLPRTKTERDRILGLAHVSVENYNHCLEPWSQKIGAGNKVGLTFSGMMVGFGATLIGCGALREKIKLNISPNNFLWLGIPFLIGAVAFHLISLPDSESFGGNLGTAVPVGVGVGALWTALTRRSMVNLTTLPYYLSLGGAGILAIGLLFNLMRPEISPSPGKITTRERVLSAGNYLIDGVGFSFLGLGLYRHHPGKFIPAHPLLAVSVAAASISGVLLAYCLGTASQKHETDRVGLGVNVFGLLCGMAVGVGGIALALLPRGNNLSDDFILMGVAASVAIGGLMIIGTNETIEKEKRHWKAVLNPSQ